MQLEHIDIYKPFSALPYTSYTHILHTLSIASYRSCHLVSDYVFIAAAYCIFVVVFFFLLLSKYPFACTIYSLNPIQHNLEIVGTFFRRIGLRINIVHRRYVDTSPNPATIHLMLVEPTPMYLYIIHIHLCVETDKGGQIEANKQE